MSYYQLKHAIEPEKIGVLDGMAQVELVRSRFVNKKSYDDYLNYFMDYSAKGYENILKFPEQDVVLEHLRPRKKAILSDYLCFSPANVNKFLISNKLQKIIQQFKLPPYRLYDATVFVGKKENKDYKFLYLPVFDMSVVNFSKSVFSKEDKFGNRQVIDAPSVEDLRKIGGIINRDRIILKSSFDRELDLFNLTILSDVIISERFRQKLIQENVTGIEIKALQDSFEVEL